MRRRRPPQDTHPITFHVKHIQAAISEVPTVNEVKRLARLLTVTTRTRERENTRTLHAMNLSFLLLTWLSVAFQATATDTVTNPESRKLLQHRIDPGLLDEVASDFSKTELSTLESFLRRRGEKASPPPPPSPARSEMCMGIPFKRYRFVKSMGEIRNALSQVCSNLPSPSVFSAHTRVSHVHSPSLSRLCTHADGPRPRRPSRAISSRSSRGSTTRAGAPVAVR